MWSKNTSGKWLHRESETRMAESSSEAGDVTGSMLFQIGDSITAFTYPLTEGLIIARNSTEDSKLELTIIVAPFKKRGRNWSRAAVVTRDAAKLSKKMPTSFTFPIKNVEVLRLEAKNAKGDSAWAFATCVALDRYFCQNAYGSGASDSEIQEEEEPQVKESRGPTKQLEIEDAEDKQQDQLSARIEEVIKLRDKTIPKTSRIKERSRSSESESDNAKEKRNRKQEKKRKKKKAEKRKKRTSSSSSSSPSSSSSSDSSDNSGEVREIGKSGRFICPFDREDSRGFKNVKQGIKGQTVIRKQVRTALHNLYAEHTTMKIFADMLISQANASPFKPFSTDTSWLGACARYIDTILLKSLGGPWALWDEPILDELMMGFLELVTRVSHNKEYPICLDDSVRKWMKKKRVGANQKYGPVSYAMQHATFTDCGPVLYQAGWQKQRERNSGRSISSSSTSKAPQITQGGGEKKPMPPSSSS